MERILTGITYDSGFKFEQNFTIEQARQWLIDYGVPNAKKFSDESVAVTFFKYYQ